MNEPRNEPFFLLRDYEKRSLVHAVGLPEQALAQGTWSGIAFSVDEYNLVSEIGHIVEILTVPAVTRVPGAKSWVLGVANVRGTLVPVVDFRKFLGGEATVPTKYTRVLVVQQSGGVVGLMIDEVHGQRHFLIEEECDEGQYAERPIARFLTREYRKGDTTWGALDVARLVHNPDFMQAAA